MNHSVSSFLCGCTPFEGLVFFSKELDEFAEQGIVNSSFFLWYEKIADEKNRWMKYDESVSWRAMGLATVEPRGGNRVVVAIGSKGQYFEVDTKALKEELGVVDGDISGVRCLCTVEDTIYAAGMGRIVLKRVSTGQWVEFGPGMEDSDQDIIVGFEDVAGFSQSDIYTVGWRGEVWWFNKDAWKQIDSPTTGNFNALTCAGDGVVYAVGDNGLMVRGRGDQWEIIETERPENLMDVAFFEDEVYVVTDYKILKLKDDQLVPVDNFEDGDSPSTCLYLYESKDGVVSMGPKDLFRLYQGLWERLI